MTSWWARIEDWRRNPVGSSGYGVRLDGSRESVPGFDVDAVWNNFPPRSGIQQAREVLDSNVLQFGMIERTASMRAAHGVVERLERRGRGEGTRPLRLLTRVVMGVNGNATNSASALGKRLGSESGPSTSTSTLAARRRSGRLRTARAFIPSPLQARAIRMTIAWRVRDGDQSGS